MALSDVLATEMAHYSFGEFLLCPEQRRLWRRDSAVEISSRALDLLIVLVQSAGRVLERGELLRAVWGAVTVADSNLTVNLCTLRHALGDCQHYIATVPGRGYQFTAPVQVERLEAAMAPEADRVRVTVEAPLPGENARQWAASVAAWLEAAVSAPRE